MPSEQWLTNHKRVVCDLTIEDYNALKDLAWQRRTTVAELVRRLIQEELRPPA